MWVPWRAGATSREQALARQHRRVKGRVRASVAREKAVQKRRQELLRQAKRGKITEAQYRQALRKLGG